MNPDIIITIAFFITIVALAVGVPLARAFVRQIDRRSSPLALSSGVENQLQQLQQSLDSVALEVERISEAQRFTTRLLTERGTEGENGAGTPARAPVSQSQRES